MRGPRAGQADYDDGGRQLDRRRLGVPQDEVLKPQAGRHQADQPAFDDVSPDPRQPAVCVDRAHLDGQPLGHPGPPEVHQTGLGAGLGQHAVDAELHLHLPREVVEGLFVG